MGAILASKRYACRKDITRGSEGSTRRHKGTATMMNVVGGVERCGEIEKTCLNGFDIRFITSPFASNETKNT